MLILFFSHKDSVRRFTMRSLPLAHFRFSVLMLALSAISGEQTDRKPNFVLMMVDDMGIGDVGCYGNNTIRTPNIDRLASEGIKLTQHIAAAPLCTPSRAAFLTGRHALRSGMDSVGGAPVLLFLAGSGGLPPNETTFPKRLQQQGYTTGLVGKWHLGVSCERRGDHCHHPNQHGFSYFYGMPFTLFDDCQPGRDTVIMEEVQVSLQILTTLLGIGLITLVCFRILGLLSVSLLLLTALFVVTVLVTAVWIIPFKLLPIWNCIIMRNQEVIEQPLTLETLPQRLLDEALDFMKRNADRPFLLFFSFVHVHVPLFINPAFAGKSRHGYYGDNLEEMDWMIGKVTDMVDSLGLTNNTLMYFTSDHGGHLELVDAEMGQTGGWNGIFKGGKAMGGWEGGIRVPGIFRWPGRLAAGEVVDEPTSLMDIYPTLKYLAKDTQPDRNLDGHNLMPLLEGQIERSEHEFMFHYCGVDISAVRWHPPGSDSVYKVHYLTPKFSPPGAIGCYDTGLCFCDREQTRHNPPMLYDIFHDPSESRPLMPDTEPRYAEILQRTAQAVKNHQNTLANEQQWDDDGSQPVAGAGALTVESQMTMDKIVWRPWLQPCCGTFPFCGCKEEK
ncbi:arylsulfatase D [Antennarius striatus]|uniref:arylsulfatase D n=1 Tax=Antennarius striatus TaxID=241820 RepID=UPI0035B2423D